MELIKHLVMFLLMRARLDQVRLTQLKLTDIPTLK